MLANHAQAELHTKMVHADNQDQPVIVTNNTIHPPIYARLAQLDSSQIMLTMVDKISDVQFTIHNVLLEVNNNWAKHLAINAKHAQLEHHGQTVNAELQDQLAIVIKNMTLQLTLALLVH
jgi:hypothetical protein